MEKELKRRIMLIVFIALYLLLPMFIDGARLDVANVESLMPWMEV